MRDVSEITRHACTLNSMRIVRHKKLIDHILATSPVVATRELYYSLPGCTVKEPLTIKLYSPVLINDRSWGRSVPVGAFACYVSFDQLHDGYFVYGYDELQALHLATDIDLFLKRSIGERNLFHLGGDEYVFYF